MTDKLKKVIDFNVGDILKPFFLNPILLVRLIRFKTQKYNKRKYKYTFFSFLSLVVFVTPFQNCKGTKFSSSDIQTSSLSSTDGSTSGQNTSGGNTTPGGSNTTNNSAEIENKINETCFNNASAPVIDSLDTAEAPNEVTINSALSPASGNSAAKNIKVNFRKIVKDAKVETDNECSRRVVMMLNTQFISNTTYISQLTNAINYNGTNVAGAQGVAQQAGNILQLNSETSVDSNKNHSGTLRVDFANPGSDGFLRCVQGTIWVAIQVRQYISGRDPGTGTSSANKYLKLNMKNTCFQQTKLTETNPISQLSQFGSKISADGQWLAVLAPNESKDSQNLSVGGVHIYQLVNGGWTHSATLFPQTDEKGLGLSDILLKGDKLFVSSAFVKGANGRVYYYRLGNNNWSLQQEIQPPVAGEIQFGTSLAFNGTTLFVGAPAHMQRGSVFSFTNNSSSFSYLKTFEPQTNIKNNMAYGQSLAVGGSSQTKLLVGAPQTKLDSAAGTGQVYILETSDIDYQKGVIFPRGAIKDITGQRFGLAVAISSADQVVIGSPELTASGRNMAGAFTFHNSLASATSTSDTGMKVITSTTASTQMGASVALNGTYVYIGLPEMNASPKGISRSGRVIRYTTSTLLNASPTAIEIFPTDHTANSFFGTSLSLVSNSLVVGARLKSNPNRDSGATYIFAQ